VTSVPLSLAIGLYAQKQTVFVNQSVRDNKSVPANSNIRTDQLAPLTRRTLALSETGVAPSKNPELHNDASLSLLKGARHLLQGEALEALVLRTSQTVSARLHSNRKLIEDYVADEDVQRKSKHQFEAEVEQSLSTARTTSTRTGHSPPSTVGPA